ERGTSYLPGALGNVIRHRKDLAGLLIEQQMIIAEMTATDVPVESFCFHVQTEDVRQELAQRARNLGHCFPAQIHGAVCRFHFWLCHLLQFLSDPRFGLRSPAFHDPALPSCPHPSTPTRKSCHGFTSDYLRGDAGRSSDKLLRGVRAVDLQRDRCHRRAEWDRR